MGASSSFIFSNTAADIWLYIGNHGFLLAYRSRMLINLIDSNQATPLLKGENETGGKNKENKHHH